MTKAERFCEIIRPFPIFIILSLLFLIWSSFLTAEEPDPLVKKVGATTYRIEEVTFDAKTGEVSIPVTVNLREGGPVEYLLVHENGKIHESILTTTARPRDLQIALKLLKYQPGEGDVFDRFLPSEDRQLKGGKSEERGTTVSFKVLWEDEEGVEQTESAHRWIIDGDTKENRDDPGEPMPEHPWNFTGSLIHEGQFMAELEGSIIAIYLDPVAMFNTTVRGSEFDERWGANHLAIPQIGTHGTLVISRTVE